MIDLGIIVLVAVILMPVCVLIGAMCTNAGRDNANIPNVENKNISRYDVNSVFQQGQLNMSTLITLALFKLSQEGELFGYEDIIEKVAGVLNKEFKDQKIVNEWLKKLGDNQKK